MLNLAWLLTGGFAKGYRTQILGLTTALSTIALWAVGLTMLACRHPQPPSPPRQNDLLPPHSCEVHAGSTSLATSMTNSGT